MKKNKQLIFYLILFLVSRIVILLNPPPFYSDVFHDYRRYANMWYSGLTPYLKHFYEYPPTTIPVLYTPLMVKNIGLGHYYQNYRFQIFLFDLIIFFFIFNTIKKLKIKPIQKKLSLGFYFLAPMIAKDFFYEGIDWLFISALTLSIIYQSKNFLSWVFFWLSTSIKFLTAPLAAIYLYLNKQNLLKTLQTLVLSFLLVWGLPLAIFRSSLSVMFVFHQNRGIKYASFPGFLVESINYFTQTETRLNKPPDFELQGPISDLANKVVTIIFPLCLLAVLAYGLITILRPNLKKIPKTIKKIFLLQPFKLNHLDPYVFSLKIALIFIFTVFLSGKIFSQPFHLWYIPLIALFPFKKIKKQLTFIILALILIIVDTTPWIRLPEALVIIYPLPLKFFSYLLLRYVPMTSLLFLSIKLPNK